MKNGLELLVLSVCSSLCLLSLSACASVCRCCVHALRESRGGEKRGARAKRARALLLLPSPSLNEPQSRRVKREGRRRRAWRFIFFHRAFFFTQNLRLLRSTFSSPCSFSFPPGTERDRYVFVFAPEERSRMEQLGRTSQLQNVVIIFFFSVSLFAQLLILSKKESLNSQATAPPKCEQRRSWHCLLPSPFPAGRRRS